MTAVRMRVGQTVVSWGALPKRRGANLNTTLGRMRPTFIVIEGGRDPVADIFETEARSAPVRHGFPTHSCRPTDATTFRDAAIRPKSRRP